MEETFSIFPYFQYSLSCFLLFLTIFVCVSIELKVNPINIVNLVRTSIIQNPISTNYTSPVVSTFNQFWSGVLVLLKNQEGNETNFCSRLREFFHARHEFWIMERHGDGLGRVPGSTFLWANSPSSGFLEAQSMSQYLTTDTFYLLFQFWHFLDGPPCKKRCWIWIWSQISKIPTGSLRISVFRFFRILQSMHEIKH